MPEIRSFRALRYDPAVVGDLAGVVSPPYDVIGPELQRTLLERHPANVVRLDLPPGETGDEPDDRYRRAARTLAAWRSGGILHRDSRPATYVYEQTYRVPGSKVERRQRGFFGRLRLESFGPEGDVLPHERTLAGPREDRYRLLRATAVNTSPVVGLYADHTGRSAAVLRAIAATPPVTDIEDHDRVRHRLWIVADDADPSGASAELARLAGAGPITIADGHHRYETALRYRDERRTGATQGDDHGYDYLLALFLESTAQTLTVLPTHRLLRDLGDGGVQALFTRAAELFEIRDGVAAEELRVVFGPEGRATGTFGLWTRSGGAILSPRPTAFDPYLPAGGSTLRALDVTLLGIALERIAGIDAAAVGGGDRLSYVHDAAEAVSRVDAGLDEADAAFLLAPTPVEAVVAVAGDGDVMPQKSTYFYPKALTGLVINPHEW